MGSRAFRRLLTGAIGVFWTGVSAHVVAAPPVGLTTPRALVELAVPSTPMRIAPIEAFVSSMDAWDVPAACPVIQREVSYDVSLDTDDPWDPSAPRFVLPAPRQLSLTDPWDGSEIAIERLELTVDRSDPWEVPE